MNIPYSWLVELLPDLPAAIQDDPRNLEPILAMLGTGVEDITEFPAPPQGVVFGVVQTCESIPDTHLFKLEVNVGLEGVQQIVTGAPNARAGIGVAVAPPGATIQGVKLEARAIQGVTSWGMVCSPKELGIGEYGAGILELPVSEAAPGTQLSSIWAADSVLDVEVTPNRADALSVLGVARDLAAKLNLELKPPSRGLESAQDDGFPVQVEIAASHGCDRFVARMARGVKNGPSPAWVQRRLTLCGMRPINALVDASNYVMMELGQPSAAYDARDLPEHKIVVRDALEGEHVVGLDGKEYVCTPADLLVTTPVGGESKAIGIGSMLGAQYSSIQPDTQDVILEVAHWDPVRMRLTGRRLDIATDALYRYERGVDVNLPVWAADRYMQLVLEACGGEVVPGHRDVGGAKDWNEITLRPWYVNDFLGTDYEYDEMKAALERLGFEVSLEQSADVYPLNQGVLNLSSRTAVLRDTTFVPIAQQLELSQSNEEIQRLLEENNKQLSEIQTLLERSQTTFEKSSNVNTLQLHWRVRCPTWRVNMDLEEDLIEEIARVLGYDAIPTTVPNFRVNDLTRTASKDYDRTRGIKDVFVGLGFQEVLAYSFTSLAEAARTRVLTPTVELRNPQSAERTHMRSSLVSGMLGIAQTNRAAGNVMLVEVGRVFPSPEKEEERLGLLMMGDLAAKTWQPAVKGGFYAFKGLLEAAAARLGGDVRMERLEDVPAFLHPGIAGSVVWNGQVLGVIGALHPSVAKDLELPGDVMLAELTLPLPERAWAFSDPSRQPAALRDLAIIAPKSLAYSRLEAIARSAAGEFLERVDVFDVFESERIGAGKRSVAITLTWRAQDRTLTDAEVGAAFEAVIAAMRAEGLEIRDS
jgi:phenylalanyl-tRNA synthetase beta subunit